ncbi:DUF1116 domain-containing protein [Nocardioides aquiterrae]|uniref:DUF1116 domain-containing protein n=1 Tax=Nocardioides aquiterrae TaxID=203799 RepID=UPI0031E46645
MSVTPVVELPEAVDVVNIGLPLFESALRSQGQPVIGVDWRIPGGGEPRIVAALARLLGPGTDRIDRANAEVLRRLDEGVPMLVGIDRAGAVIEGMGERDILHCGPAIAWEDMPDPLQRSVRAAVVAEGWADDVDGAGGLVEAGEVHLRPANEHRTVVPMATSIGPSAPVYVVHDEAGSSTAYSSINQGSGAVQWFGVDSDAAIDRLRFVRDKLGPVLAEALATNGPVDVFALAAQGVPMGDDVHMRVQATTNLFLRDLLPSLVRSTHAAAAEVATFLSANHLMFLNVAMAAAKSLVEWASEVPDSSIVTTMSRNGSTYGVRLAGGGDWFLAPSPPVQDALYYPGFGPETSAPDIGDSAVLELVGLGGPAAANSPAVAGFLGGRMSHAIAATRSMQRICAGESARFRLPILDNVGTPLGVDVRKVVELGITPAVNTGIIHATDGSGQVGAGVAWAPLGCFVDALLDLDRRLA